MTILPRLKAVPVHGHGSTLVLYRRSLERIYLDDPTGAFLALLKILARGDHSVDQLPSAIAAVGHPATTAQDVSRVLHQLDEWGVLERADADGELDASTMDRHASNLRYYDLFSDLSRTSADMHRAAARSTVLLLGAGGLGSGILQSLVGLGVGKIILVDGDVVETKNLARQFVYNTGDIGRPKVQAAAEWASGYSAQSIVHPVLERIADAARIGDLAASADLVICAIDSPDNVHLLVNQACCRLGIPFVAGGLARSTLSYWSARPWPVRLPGVSGTAPPRRVRRSCVGGRPDSRRPEREPGHRADRSAGIRFPDHGGDALSDRERGTGRRRRVPRSRTGRWHDHLPRRVERPPAMHLVPNRRARDDRSPGCGGRDRLGQPLS